MAFITLCTTFPLPFGFRPSAWQAVAGLAVAAIGGGITQHWGTRSPSLAQPLGAVIFNSLSLVWATILGFAVGSDAPPPTGLGSAIVVLKALHRAVRDDPWRHQPAPAR